MEHDHAHSPAVGAHALVDEPATGFGKDLRYVSLHHHSTFSYADGFQLPATHIDRAADIGMGAMALTEHGNVSSHVQLEVAARKAGIKPIFGCELYAGTVGDDRVQRKNHLTVLAENQQGYRNLLSVVTQGWSDFYYEPTVSGAVLGAHKEGLVVLSGCTGSLLSTSLIGGKNIAVEDAGYALGKQVARRFKRVFGDGYYLEVQTFPELANVCRLNEMIAQIGAELKIPLVATGDVHYTKPSENDMQMILHSVGRNKTLEQLAQDWGYDVPLSPPISDAAVLKRLVATGLTAAQAQEALYNTEVIAERCNVVLPKLDRLRFPLPPGYDTTRQLWQDMIEHGWEFRGLNSLSQRERERYQDRLDSEMRTIENKDFVDYFLVVSDMVTWAKEHDVLVGPARGSAAASLVCWLLRITEVNPMDYDNLVFERFIDVSRDDLPDIDLDFDSVKRDEVRHYLAGKYGVDCVGNLGTFNYFRSKNSLDDVGRVHNIPKRAIDTVKALLVERASGDEGFNDTIRDTVDQFPDAKEIFDKYPQLYKAMELEGNVKGMGVHAAGLVISNGPLTDVCATYERKVGEKIYQVISMDKYDAERQNLLKVDALGLSTMSIIAEALRHVGMSIQDLYDLPLDDEDVLRAFSVNDVVGVFQFDGRTMKNVTRGVKPNTFDELSDINALSRPGPLHSGATSHYIAAKWDVVAVEELHPMLTDITASTHGQLVYQEQILRVVKEIGNFDWTQASQVRKIISKSKGVEEFESFFELFRSGAQENGVRDDISREIWDRCVTAGGYAFNAAHSVSYAILAYWTMYLKVCFPEVFYAASLNHLPPDKHLDLLQDADRHGIAILPPQPSTSSAGWEAHPGAIEGGLATVRGVGDKTAQAILAAKAGALEVNTWDDLLEVKGIGKKTIAALKDFSTKLDPYNIHKVQREIAEVSAMLADMGIPPLTHKAIDIPAEHGKDQMIYWAGVIRSRQPRNVYESYLRFHGEPLDPANLKDPHLVDYVAGVGYDETEETAVVWDRWFYPQFRGPLYDIKLDHDIVVVKGIKYGFQDRRAIYVRQMWVFDPESE